MTIAVRRATRSDIESFSGISQVYSIKAIAAELDGEIIALAGVAFHKGRWLGFADLTEKVRNHKMHIMRGAKRFLNEMRQEGVKYIYVEADPNEHKAVEWLQSLGFELDHRTQYLYRWKA